MNERLLIFDNATTQLERLLHKCGWSVESHLRRDCEKAAKESRQLINLIRAELDAKPVRESE